MKKSLILLAVLLLVCGTVYAGSSSLGNSYPANLVTYYANQWSSSGSWTPGSAIPSGSTVTGVRVSWSTFGQTYSGLQMRLSNASGSSATVSNGSTSSAFNGQIANQNWSAEFKVSSLQYPGNALYVTPTLIVNWQ